jgi:hypothetical protein
VETRVAPRRDFFVLDVHGSLNEAFLRQAPHTTRAAVPQGCSVAVLPVESLVTGQFGRSKAGPLYITFNDTLKFGDGRTRAREDLLRLKLNVDVSVGSGRRSSREPCRFHAPAELIHLSFSNADDYKNTFTRGRPLGEWTQLLTLPGGGARVRAPSLHYLVNHYLFSILTQEVALPWEDVKYRKRLIRLVAGSVLLSLEPSVQPDALLYRHTAGPVEERAAALSHWLQKVYIYAATGGCNMLPELPAGMDGDLQVPADLVSTVFGRLRGRADRDAQTPYLLDMLSAMMAQLHLLGTHLGSVMHQA